MRDMTAESYLNRIQRVLDYIYDHMDDDLNVMKLAEVACFSDYHFHRIYRGLVGETVTQTLRRLRLQRAARDLIDQTYSMAQIADRAGYGSIEAFSRSFKSAYGIAPAGYGDRIRDVPLDLLQAQRKHLMFDVTIETHPVRKIAAIPHQGSYMTIGRAFEKLYSWAGHQGLDLHVPALGVYYDNPDDVPEDQLRSEAALFVGDDADFKDENTGLRCMMLEGGRYAEMTFKGSYAELHQAYGWLFGGWLNQSNEIPKDAPCVEIYLNDPKTTPADELLTKICVALKD